MTNQQKHIVIVGATSGLGLETAKIFIQRGCTVGIAGRREERLKEIQQLAPERIHIQPLDICHHDAPEQLQQLIEKVGGMDIYVHCSGVGFQNFDLKPEIELTTLETNGTGFTRMMTAAFHYFISQRRGGQIAIISSIAGTKGLGVAPAYSATKRFQNTYIDALEQLSKMHRRPITFTDIRPGFVATDLLNDSRHYPLMMQPARVAQHIVYAIDHKQRIAVIDWRFRLLTFFWRLIPQCLWKRLPIKN